MAEIRQFRAKKNYDDLLSLEEEDFKKEIENYRNNPKLKKLIDRYLDVTTEGYANLARASMRRTPETIEQARGNREFLAGIALAQEAGVLQRKISRIIADL